MSFLLSFGFLGEEASRASRPAHCRQHWTNALGLCESCGYVHVTHKALLIWYPNCVICSFCGFLSAWWGGRIVASGKFTEVHARCQCRMSCATTDLASPVSAGDELKAATFWFSRDIDSSGGHWS